MLHQATYSFCGIFSRRRKEPKKLCVIMYLKPVRRMLVQYDKSGLDMNAIATMPMLQVLALSLSFVVVAVGGDHPPYSCSYCRRVAYLYNEASSLETKVCLYALADGSAAQYG